MTPKQGKGRTWAIGDIHGCRRTLDALLEELPFRERKDRLWLVGDLVNRGTGSRDVLLWARERHRDLGDRFRMVLGNHDLHLIAVARGVSKLRRGDTLEDVLEGTKRRKLVRWLESQPFVHAEDGWILVHAGLRAKWSAGRATRVSTRLQEVLTGEYGDHLLRRRPRGGLPQGLEKRRRQLAVLTRMRMLHPNGAMARFSGHPDLAPKKLSAWHEHPEPRWSEDVVVCGHWAAQGLRIEPQMLGLDSACVWGGHLSAMCLETGELIQVKARKKDLPG